MPDKRVTNAVLFSEIQNIDKRISTVEELIKTNNGKMDKRVVKNDEEIRKNSIAVAGIKGAAGVISLGVSAISAFLINYVLNYTK
jgi:hypothetical protein